MSCWFTRDLSLSAVFRNILHGKNDDQKQSSVAGIFTHDTNNILSMHVCAKQYISRQFMAENISFCTHTLNVTKWMRVGDDDWCRAAGVFYWGATKGTKAVSLRVTSRHINQGRRALGLDPLRSPYDQD